MPFRVAMVSIAAASQRPFGSVTARAPRRSPEARGGSRSVFRESSPACRIAPAVSTAEEKYGAHSSARPISSQMMPSSTKENPCPPKASGMCTADKPSSRFRRFQTLASNPASVSMRRRTSTVADVSRRKRPKMSRKCSCSSVNAKAMIPLTDAPYLDPMPGPFVGQVIGTEGAPRDHHGVAHPVARAGLHFVLAPHLAVLRGDGRSRRPPASPCRRAARPSPDWAARGGSGRRFPCRNDAE